MSVTQQIKDELLSDRSKETIHRWAQYLAEHPEIIEDCLPFLIEPAPLPMRICWVFDHVVDHNPACMIPHIPYLFSLRNDMAFRGFRRNLTRILANSGVPESLEAEVIETLFNWVLDSDIELAIKVHSIQTLYNLCQKYPDLSGELIDVIEDQIPKTSVGFKSRGQKLLAKLRKERV